MRFERRDGAGDGGEGVRKAIKKRGDGILYWLGWEGRVGFGTALIMTDDLCAHKRQNIWRR